MTTPAGEAQARLVRRGAAALAVLLWGAACFLPTFYVGPTTPPGFEKLWEGGLVLAIGWLGPLVFTLAWYANIPWAIGVVQALLGKRPGRITTTIAFVLGLTMFAMREAYGEGEGGHGPVSLRIGAFVWLASLLPLLAVAWMQPKSPKAPPAA